MSLTSGRKAKMSTTEIVRTNIKLDRRWVSCGNQPMCATMASVAPQHLVSWAEGADVAWLRMHREWLARELAKFTGPPGMELRTLDDDEIESPVDYYAILLRVPMPNSQDPSKIFPVGRLGYSYQPINSTGYEAAAQELLARDVYNLMQALAAHEVKEWVKYDGKHVVEPHPEN